MKRYDFNRGWTCRALKPGGEPIPVTLPHDAMRTEARVGTSLGEGNIGWYEGGDYEYRKIFTLPEDLAGQKLILEFESVYHNAEVWLNGQKLASRPYGYTNFYAELNGALQEGENELLVIARNADQPNSRWYSGTGIFRPVWLWAAGEKHVKLNGLRIRTLSIRPAKIAVTVETSVPGQADVEILDGGTVVAKESGSGPFELEIPEAKLWNVDTPHLYTCRVRFGDDVVEERFGIRTLSWTPEKGVAINGERVVIRGACIHHDNGILGACSYPEAEERRIRILKQAGYNAVRSAHNPCSKYQLEVCDRLGMLMMDEYVDCWYMHKTQYDYASFVTDWWKRDMKDMVDKDYNHPCVILYSTGNEVAETAQEKGIALQREFTEYLHQLDGLGKQMPVTFGCFAVGALGLIGIPPFAGFVSKWNLLSAGLSGGTFLSGLGSAALLISALLTAIYCLTPLRRAFFPDRQAELSELNKIHDPGWRMSLPILILAAGILVTGLCAGAMESAIAGIIETVRPW